MNGYQLAVAARQLQPRLKVLFTTGYERDAISREPDDGQPGPVLRKPYRRQDLAATVRAVLENY